MQNFISILLLLVLGATVMKSQTPGPETIIVETNYGTMHLKLYEETPRHRENFLKLVNNHFYDSTLFHRVIAGFMIQAGDPKSKRAMPGDTLGDGDLDYTVPAEFNPKLIHLKGRLCAAREGDDKNPQMASSACQFYIVVGKKRTREDLNKYEDRINKTFYLRCGREYLKSEQGLYEKLMYNQLKQQGNLDSAEVFNKKIEDGIKHLYNKRPEFHFSPETADAYMKVGGTPHLDGTYTVFGEVTFGMDVVDAISAVKTDKRDRPLDDVRIRSVRLQ